MPERERAASEPDRRRFFDAHCDTAMKVLDAGADFLTGEGDPHISLPAMERAGVGAQIFACFVLSERHPGAEAKRAMRMIEEIEGWADRSAGRLRIVRCCRDLRAAFDGGPIGAILGLEGADLLEGRAENLRALAARGVRNLIFAWKDNAFSGTAFGTNAPLTREGERLLGIAEELSVMVDVSHLSDRAFWNVAEAARQPFIASHSNCRALCPHPRNLTDPMIRELADRGGVMGINLAPAFLDADYGARAGALHRAALRPEATDADRNRLAGEARSLCRPGIAAVVRQIVHAIAVGGEACVGIGGDLDGILVPPAGIESIADYPKLVPALDEAGLTPRQVENVLHRNFLRVFSELLGG